MGLRHDLWTPAVPGRGSRRQASWPSTFTAGGGGQHSPGASGCRGYAPPSLRCPCAACASGAPRPAPLRSVGGAPCAGRSDGCPGRVSLVPGRVPPVVPRPRAVSPPVVAGSIALGCQGAGGMPLLASARRPCAARTSGVSRLALLRHVGDAPCAGRCGGRSGRIPCVPGCVSARGILPRTCRRAGWRLEVHHMGDVPLPLLTRARS